MVDYKKGLEAIAAVSKNPQAGVIDVSVPEGRVLFEEQLHERRTGRRLIRATTPLQNINPQDVQSPSCLASDHMLLPKMSQADLDLLNEDFTYKVGNRDKSAEQKESQRELVVQVIDST